MKADQETSYFFEGRSATILVREKKKSKFHKEKKIQMSLWFITAQNVSGHPLSGYSWWLQVMDTHKETQRIHFISVKVLTLGELSTPDFLKGFSILGERPHRGVSLREERLP